MGETRKLVFGPSPNITLMPDSASERHEEFVALMARHQRAIYGYIFTLVQHHADSDDLLQQTSLVLWRKFAEFEPETNFLAWACRIARFEVLNYLKSKKHGACPLSEGLLNRLADERLARTQEHELHREALDGCLKKLGEQDQQLVRLCYGESKSFKQAAAELGRPANSVYVSLSRIRGVLLDCVHRALGQESAR